MTEETTFPVRYVGKKDQRTDSVAGTGTVWIGHGDVQRVPASAVPKLLRHPDVWELADGGEATTPTLGQAKKEEPGFFGTNHPESVEIAGQAVGLGDLIHAAAAADKLDAEAWNALTDEERQAKVDAEIKRRSAPPEPPKNKGGRPPGSKNKA